MAYMVLLVANEQTEGSESREVKVTKDEDGDKRAVGTNEDGGGSSVQNSVAFDSGFGNVGGSAASKVAETAEEAEAETTACQEDVEGTRAGEGK